MEFPAVLRVFLTRAIRFALLLVLGHPIQHLIAIVTHAVAEGSGVAEALLGVTLMGAKLSVLPFLDCLDFLGYLGGGGLSPGRPSPLLGFSVPWFFGIPWLILSKEFPWLFVFFSAFSKVSVGSAGDRNPWLI